MQISRIPYSPGRGYSIYRTCVASRENHWTGLYTRGQDCQLYECTVTDPLDPPVASTVWLGTAFNCPSATDSTNNRITVQHESFQSGGAAGVCDDLFAMSIGMTTPQDRI